MKIFLKKQVSASLQHKTQNMKIVLIRGFYSDFKPTLRHCVFNFEIMKHRLEYLVSFRPL